MNWLFPFCHLEPTIFYFLLYFDLAFIILDIKFISSRKKRDKKTENVKVSRSRKDIFLPRFWQTWLARLFGPFFPYSPSSQGATHSFSFALLSIVSGRGSECLTMAPYSPYSAMIVLRPQHFSVLRHLALRFWNQTCRQKKIGLWGSLL